MVKFAVIFEDNPGVGIEQRRKYMSEHLAFLERNATRVKAAGPLKAADGQGAGGLWIVDATDASEVDLLVKEDPFWPTGLRKSVRILTWTQVFVDGQPLVAV